ncbi:MAG: hypothetical protein HY744_21995 [Deltaproteobacteria bacterium]|nr:hypothetical protein [Deltaproteobacteria bacterium]
MFQFFIEGGWGTWPTLVFGLVLLWAAGRYAWDGAPPRLRFAVAMAVVEAVTCVHAVLSGLATVSWYLEDPKRAPDAQLVRILMTGIKESSRSGMLGGTFLLLASVLVAIGVYRTGRREVGAG